MKTLKELRKRITDYDFWIVDRLIVRSRELLNEEFYAKRSNHPEFKQNSALFHYIHSTYLPIISEVCQKGDDKEDRWDIVFGIDFPLITNIMRRTGLGVDIAKYKDPRGLPVYIKEVEERKLKELGDFVESRGVDREGILRAMQLIMKETKRIEDMTIECMNEICPSKESPPFETYRAGTEQARDVLENIAKEEIKKLEKETPFKYSLKARKEDTIYLVEIHKV